MTKQADLQKSLGRSRAGCSTLCTIAVVISLVTGGAAFALGQAASASPQATSNRPAAKTPAKASTRQETIYHGYRVHQSIELGGRITEISGSHAMWNSLVNQSTGLRILGQSLEMRSVNTSKTPLFDTLTTYSTGFGGDPSNVSRLQISKGRWYDFAGSFRRSRNYFDYNQFTNSLLTNYTATSPVLVPEPSTLHLFNTVRRTTDTNLTLLPLSAVNVRFGFNHGTHEGPTLNTLHGGGDVLLNNWFRNAQDQYTAGVNVKVARRTTISYDQFLVYYKGDSTFQLTGADYPTVGGNGVMESLGVNTLAGSTCGTGTNKTAEVVNGQANPYCSGTITESEVAPNRTHFTTEQLRFSSHYWDRVLLNGRYLYSDNNLSVPAFKETFVGLVTRSGLLKEVETGGGTRGLFAHNKRINTNADFGIVAEAGKYVSLSDAVNYWGYRTNGNSTYNIQSWTVASGASILTPLTSATETSVTNTDNEFLNQTIFQNTLLATFAVTPQFKLSTGWRIKKREISNTDVSSWAWHENTLLLGAVVQLSRMVRINVNFEGIDNRASNRDTPVNTYTRAAPNRSYRIWTRATIKPDKWVSFALAGGNHTARNNDVFVNHREHLQNFSFTTTITPADNLSFDLSYSYDSIYSRTDLCYAFTANANAPLPAGATNAGTCTAANSPEGSSSFYLSDGLYDEPTNFFSGSVNYAPVPRLNLFAGARTSNVNGTAETLNPFALPGSLHSRYFSPFADLELKVAPQWAWHGNWTYNGYGELGAANAAADGLLKNGLPARNSHGNVVSLGVKYAF
jgi:hypothetical protein